MPLWFGSTYSCVNQPVRFRVSGTSVKINVENLLTVSHADSSLQLLSYFESFSWLPSRDADGVYRGMSGVLLVGTLAEETAVTVQENAV